MRRKSIKLQPHDDHLLRVWYLILRTPSDQWAQRPKMLARLCNEWRLGSGRHETDDELRHYIINKRKCKQWVTFDGDYDPLRCPGENALTPEEDDALRAAYTEINKGRDQYAADGTLRDMLAHKFYARSGRFISGELLYAIAMARQKHKSNGWPRLTDEDGTSDLGFGDIGDVG